MSTPASTNIAMYTGLQRSLRARHADHRGRATASRRARANGLNCASTTWWALRPLSTIVDVQRDPRLGDDRLEDVLGERRVVGPDELDDLGLVVHEVGAARQVERQRTSASSRGTSESPYRRMPTFVAERLAQRPGRRRARCPRRCWCASMCEVALGAHDEVESRRASRSGPACGRRTARPCRSSLTPVPSISTSTGRRSPSSCAARARTCSCRDLLQRRAERRVLLRRADADAQPPPGPVSRISTRGRAALPTACRSAKVPNNTKFASLSATSLPPARSHVDEVARARAQQRDLRLQLVGVRERRAGHRLRDRRQVVGQPHQLHRRHHSGVGGG